ncbi:beta-xylosidase/alpha-l-arabinosidase [Phytomonospora endophytica]|uniref:Beta-xylosidase n=1 Tax=Phytomonospora endophytica TaxID=714109 RepID=A0A841FT69_9ACTN|nr:glycoside hydrolase family 3 N-terminal domain-containing protein [Phytomonospora endophytica]MBB6036938.1 beta-xylosidase [Phytomonospora endophytica]GIG68031.1 beta-glucosidase [Phytomonospora endophytica]
MDSREETHRPWQDTSATVGDRAAALLAAMTLTEKTAQLYGVWIGVTPAGADVAPHQHEFADDALDFDALITHGLGQLTRPFGTAPVEAAQGAKALARMQADIRAAGRHGVPALVHEECLTGFMTWGATIYPTPLAWGATFNPALVEAMARQIGTGMRQVGVHQGLAPVLDVTRDPRWGRTEETIGEDPYLVATLGTAYVRGLRDGGIVPTLKHFAGYAASAAGRNFAPVAIGPRELADDVLFPFELALRDGGADSVMHAYTEIDGLPTAADPALLTGLLRETWGFTGTVVSDYFGVSFLELLHGVAASPAAAAALALSAGVDVELPTVRCYGDPLLAAVRDGLLDESIVDRAVTRVLRQKITLGLLDPEPARTTDPAVDLDPPEARALAAAIAEESVVLLSNDGALPLSPDARIAVVGPVADDPAAMLGCYAFPSHVAHDDDGESPAMGVDIPDVLRALHTEFPQATITHARGTAVDGDDRSGFAEAVAVATAADVCVAVLGDRAGLFGRGTSGEGCDSADLRLPGAQGQLLGALLATSTPIVLVLLSGRPYALGEHAARTAAIVQTFFPGEEGGGAVAGVLSGRVNPSGSLPVGVPREPGGQPSTYLAPMLGRRTDVSAVDPTPLFPFGHGLSYTTFAWERPRLSLAETSTEGSVEVTVEVANTGDRAGSEVVQLYLHDPVAQVTRPVVRLIGYGKVALAPGERRTVGFTVHADLSSFTGRDGHRVVEPGSLELRLGRSSADVRATLALRLTGPERVVGHDRRLTSEVTYT